jgi:hypothetical protein
MIRVVISILILCCCLCPLGLAQMAALETLPSPTLPKPEHVINFDKTLVLISNLKLGRQDIRLALKRKSGSGFCLDATCRFVVTNYHVATLVMPTKVKGQKVLRQYLATSSGDEGATMNSGQFQKPMKYNLVRDLAVLELQRPLKNYHGIGFSLAELKIGQEVDIYVSPPDGVIKPNEKVLKFHGSYKGVMITGLLAFDYVLSAGKKIAPGASGGIVVDSASQQIIGVINAFATNGEAIAVAVPASSLAEFLSKIEPALAATLFPSDKGAISPTLTDFYPKFVPPITPHKLERRPDEPENVKVLRNRAQALLDGMRNFIAVETFEWGKKDKRPAAGSAYEVQVIDGNQRFRLYPDGREHFRDIPFPNLTSTFVSGGEWSELPEMVGKEPHLKINQAPDAIIETKRIKVFQYHADSEDGICTWDTVDDFGLFETRKEATVACYGEVWTDDDWNILRISLHYELPGRWKDYASVVTYGWLNQAGKDPLLIPLTMSAQVINGKTMLWCRGRFINYKVFSTEVKITSNDTTIQRHR